MTLKPTSLHWLRPGMRVKRYLLVAGLGLLLFVLGLGAALGGAPFFALARWLDAHGVAPRILGVALAAGGFLLIVFGVRAMNRSVLSALTDPDRVPELVYKRRVLAAGPRIAVLGGGTGLGRLLTGLKKLTGRTAAVVAATDDGGSTGRLRRDFPVPAVGDLVDCLAALSEAERLPELMRHRFTRGEGLKGHTFGNLFLVTLNEITGRFDEAIREANRILALEGEVWPSTPAPAVLVAEKEDGQVVRGESRIREHPGAVRRVWLEPAKVPVMPEVERAILEAQLVVLGPGSLFSSVLAAALPPRVRAALARTPAPLVAVVNLMTEPGETDGFDAFSHVEAIHAHIGRWPDAAVVHTAPIPEAVKARYAEEGRFPVAFDPRPFEARGIALITGDFRAPGMLAQHDPDRLAAALVGWRA